MKNKTPPSTSEAFGYLINDRGEEIPITDQMVSESMAKIKLKSIGAHTGYTKAITEDMLATPDSDER